MKIAKKGNLKTIRYSMRSMSKGAIVAVEGHVLDIHTFSDKHISPTIYGLVLGQENSEEDESKSKNNNEYWNIKWILDGEYFKNDPRRSEIENKSMTNESVTVIKLPDESHDDKLFVNEDDCTRWFKKDANGWHISPFEYFSCCEDCGSPFCYYFNNMPMVDNMLGAIKKNKAIVDMKQKRYTAYSKLATLVYGKLGYNREGNIPFAFRRQLINAYHIPMEKKRLDSNVPVMICLMNQAVMDIFLQHWK